MTGIIKAMIRQKFLNLSLGERIKCLTDAGAAPGNNVIHIIIMQRNLKHNHIKQLKIHIGMRYKGDH